MVATWKRIDLSKSQALQGKVVSTFLNRPVVVSRQDQESRAIGARRQVPPCAVEGLAFCSKQPRPEGGIHPNIIGNLLVAALVAPARTSSVRAVIARWSPLT